MNKEKGSKSVGGIIVAFSWILISGYFFVNSLNTSQEAKLFTEAANWPTTQGVITASHIQRGEYTDYHVVRYEYELDGQTYSGTGVGLGVNGTQESDISKYPEGKQVTVYYQPNHPETTVLEPDRKPKPVTNLGVILFTGVFVLIGLQLLMEAIGFDFFGLKLLERWG